MACDQGTDSPGNDATSCTPCQSGYFTSGAGKPCVASPPGQFVPVGALSPRPCSPGSYSDGGAAGCSLCPAGKFSSLDGSNSAGCGFCPISYYSASPGSSLCSACSGGKVTPKPGSTSESACLSPINNFVLGFVALGMAGFGAVVYVVMGGFHFTAFIRRERVVKKQVKVYRDFVQEIINEKEDAIEKDAIEKARKNKKERQEANEYKSIKEFAKSLIFAPFAIAIVAIITLAVFAIMMAQIFFKSLIIYKQSHTFLPLLEYRQVIFQLIDDINAYLAGVPGAFVLRFFFSFMRRLFDILASFKIDFSAVGVTCEGATAPFKLLVNLFVLGVVVIVVESELQSFRGLCFQRTLERYGARLLSREYRRKKITGISSLSWYFMGLLGLVAVQLVFFVINFQTLLQFLLSLVVFSSFASSSNGTHAYSDTCNQVDGAENFDTYLSFGSSGIAYLLILPVFYEISKILCPYEPDPEPKHSEPKTNIVQSETASPMQPIQDHQASDLKGIEAFKSNTCEEKSSIWQVLSTLEPSAWLRLPMTLISPDLFLAHLTSGFVHLLRGSVAQLSQIAESNNTDVGKRRSLSDLVAKKPALLTLIHSSVVKFLESVVITLRPLKGSPEYDEWENEKGASFMPSYFELVRMEVYHLSGNLDYLAPPSKREDGTRYPMIGYFLTALLLLVPIGHFCVVGRVAFKLVVTKYLMFLQVSLGCWTPETFEAYKFVERTKEFSDDAGCDYKGFKSKVTNQKLIASFTAIVATRAIILQLVPQLAILSVFTIATAGSPLIVQFPTSVSRDDGNRVSKFIVRDCYKEAKEQEEEETRLKEHPFWIIILSAISTFVLDSRAFAFIARSYMVFLSIYVLYAPPTNTIIAVTVLVLMPVALASALRFVVVLGRAMHVKDLWWACCHEEDDTNQEQVDTGAAGSGVEMTHNPLTTVTTASHSASGGGPPLQPQSPVPPVRPQHGGTTVSAVAGDSFNLTPARVPLNFTQTFSMRLSQTGVGLGPPDLTALSGSRGSGQRSPQSQHHHQHVPDGAVHRATLLPNYSNRNVRSSAVAHAADARLGFADIVSAAAAANAGSGSGSGARPTGARNSDADPPAPPSSHY